MRIALFSDVHANLPALEACFKSMDGQKADAVYCLGDLVGYNIWPNEVIDKIRERKIPVIAGNYDYAVARMYSEYGTSYQPEPRTDIGKISLSYTSYLMKPAGRQYLRTLPAHIKVEFQLNQDKLNLLLVHGSPRKNNEYLFEETGEHFLLSLMKEADADILCFGHTHKPFHRVLSADNRFRHAINTGSAGKPKDGEPKGCYVILSINQDSSIKDKDSVGVEFVRFGYDVEKAAKAIESSPLPNEFADMLRKAY